MSRNFKFKTIEKLTIIGLCRIEQGSCWKEHPLTFYERHTRSETWIVRQENRRSALLMFLDLQYMKSRLMDSLRFFEKRICGSGGSDLSSLFWPFPDLGTNKHETVNGYLNKLRSSFIQIKGKVLQLIKRPCAPYEFKLKFAAQCSVINHNYTLNWVSTSLPTWGWSSISMKCTLVFGWTAAVSDWLFLFEMNLLQLLLHLLSFQSQLCLCLWTRFASTINYIYNIYLLNIRKRKVQLHEKSLNQ